MSNRSMKSSVKRGSSTAIGIVGFALASAVITGCSVGPDFASPQVDLPTDWKSPLLPEVGGVSSAKRTLNEDSTWWKLFDDPVLTLLVERALHDNLELKEAESRVRQARASRSIAGAGQFPSLNLSGSFLRGESGSASSASGGVQNLYQSGVDAGWEMDIFGGVRRGVEAADADLTAQEEDRRDVLVTLTGEVAFNYIGLRALQREFAITEENLKAQRDAAQLTQQRQSAGFVSTLDVANANAEVATTEAQSISLKAQIQKSIYALSILLGREPGALLQELSEPKPIPDLPPEVPVGLPSELLRRRPDIRRAEAKLHGATARVGVATAVLFPHFSLSGLLSYQAGTFANLGTTGGRRWSFSPGIDFPLFDAGKIRAQIAVQNELEEQALQEYHKTVLNALNEVEGALVDYTREQERRAALLRAVKENEHALSVATELYKSGVSEFINVLSAERALYASQDALVKSDGAVATNVVALYKALGGGWASIPCANKKCF